jgi:hypothetical protein
MFYELNTWDPSGSNSWKRSQNNHLEGTFEGSVNQFAQITLLMDLNIKFSDQALISDIFTTSITASNMVLFNSAVDSDAGISIPNILPDG